MAIAGELPDFVRHHMVQEEGRRPGAGGEGGVMEYRNRIGVLLSVLVLVLVSIAPAAGAREQTPGLPVMAGLGDSWAYGQGASDPAAGGYLALTHQALRSELDCVPAASGQARGGCKQLQLVNIARPAGGGKAGR